MLIIAIGAASKLTAQAVRGSLTGVVKDSTGTVVRGARVALKDIDRGLTYKDRSDAQGRYIIRSHSPGNYNLTVTAAGFEGYDFSVIIIHSNEHASDNVALKVGSITTTVRVSLNSSPLLQTENVPSELTSVTLPSVSTCCEAEPIYETRST